MNKPRILVVDGNPDITETIRFSLELEGYEVITAANG
jgi:CheY-like chemotaxis protein